MASLVDDLVLVRRIAAGEQDAASEFDRRHRPRFQHIARARGVLPQDCDDVAQEALMSAYRQIQGGQFRGDSQVNTWLFRIVTGAIADYGRRRARTERNLGGLENPLPDRTRVLAPKELALPASQETRLLVEQTMAAMPARLALILRMHEREGLTTNEIARRLNRSPGRVGVLIAEARRRFRELIAGCEEVPQRRRLNR